jgi:hypothetical protein
VNSEFAALLAALPPEIVEKQIGKMYLDSKRPLSKIEILDFAKMYILSMEREQVELEDEEQTLQSQTDFFKSMFERCGGQLIP